MNTPITFLQGIILIITIPIILLIIFIFFSNKNALGLVEGDYYQKAIEYQDQIDIEKETKQLSQQVSIINIENTLIVKFPAMFGSSDLSGRIVFFRPSDKTLDFSIPVDVDEGGIQIIDVSEKERGAWIVQIYWNGKSDKYYTEQRIFIEN